MENNLKNLFLNAYNDYAEAIYRHCYFRVFSEARAEELTQETFLRTWEYLNNKGKIDNIRAFLYRVANNLVIDESRKKKEKSLEALLEAGVLSEPSFKDSEKIEQDILLKEVLTAMEKLSPDTQEIIVLRYVDDLDPKEIAKVLEISSNAASVRLHRALGELKEIVKEF